MSSAAPGADPRDQSHADGDDELCTYLQVTTTAGERWGARSRGHRPGGGGPRPGWPQAGLSGQPRQRRRTCWTAWSATASRSSSTQPC